MDYSLRRVFMVWLSGILGKELKEIGLVMVSIRLEIWVKVFGFDVSFSRNVMRDLRIC